MNSVIEQQRQSYEDIERLEQAIVDLMMQDLTKHRYKLLREQKISELLDQVQSRSKQVLEMEQDELGVRGKETEGMSEHSFEEFYSRLGDIRGHHRRNAGAVVELPELEYLKYKHNPEESEERERVMLARAQDDDAGDDLEIPEAETFVEAGDEHRLETMFSGEERVGRYVDVHEQHEHYLNLKDAPRVTYLEYLDRLHQFETYPQKHKLQPAYRQYLRGVREYFEGYFSRAMPLFDARRARDEDGEARARFSAEWAEQKVLGWTTGAGNSEQDLFCGVCKKQFEKPTTLAAHLASRKHQKAVARVEGSRGDPVAPSAEQQSADERREIAWEEHVIRVYIQVLGERIRDTRANVERRQALTEEERDQEVDEEVAEFVEDKDDEQDEQVYNPLNLPLGWDGKPIPYWLYKLHGLGAKFSCEICGSSVYRGRKAYERHFQEARHATNMRRLGIPNTRQKLEAASADTIEEYEDGEGNVFNKKTYFDLKRQGLI
ncbi:Pre-mRNA-splicing factor sap61 [Coemansia thaxteri]|nr:Pre-mRNA-splicing factor sap61 [Coemansia thaxteri]